MNQEYKEHYNSKVLIFAGDGRATYKIEGKLKSETDEKLFLTDANLRFYLDNTVDEEGKKLSVAKSKLVAILSA